MGICGLTFMASGARAMDLPLAFELAFALSRDFGGVSHFYTTSRTSEPSNWACLREQVPRFLWRQIYEFFRFRSEEFFVVIGRGMLGSCSATLSKLFRWLALGWPLAKAFFELREDFDLTQVQSSVTFVGQPRLLGLVKLLRPLDAECLIIVAIFSRPKSRFCLKRLGLIFRELFFICCEKFSLMSERIGLSNFIFF